MHGVHEGLTLQHSNWMVAMAVVVCVLGGCLSAKLMRRLVVASGKRKRLQVFLSGMIGATTIWSTHFVAMLAHEPDYPHGFEGLRTVVSLGVAMVGVTLAMALLGYARGFWKFLGGGTVFGVSVAIMHYVGMSAYVVPGRLVWDVRIMAASVLFGAFFGVIAFQRITRPITRLCWLGAGVMMALSICTMHFTGMAAFTVDLVPFATMPEEAVHDHVLGGFVFGVTAVLFFVGFVGMTIETNMEREALGKIETTVYHDPLTGLPNRLLAAKRAREIAARLEQDITRRVAVITIDLNRFKEVNNFYGAAAGDAVLIETARRLNLACQGDDFLARLGGDEYVIFKTDFRRVDEVKAFAERLHARLVEPLLFTDRYISIDAAIGIATSVEEGRDLDDLTRKSELAMTQAKAASGQYVAMFSAEIQEQNRDRIMLINDLRHAAEMDEFRLVYQMQNIVDTRAPVGFEALLRWHHSTRGLIPPADFIPLAEETGLICEIGIWVLRRACLDAAAWDEPYRIAVNVAPQQLAQPSFLEHLSDILMESRLEPDRLELEVTEASIIDDRAHTLKVMHQIKEMGVCIAMDDFGTGYSSLATLRAFPFDKIKIDRSFIRDVHLDNQRTAIVRSILLLGHALEIPVLAEGVEVEDELAFLKEERCEYVQGFLFGRPMSSDVINGLVLTADQTIAT